MPNPRRSEHGIEPDDLTRIKGLGSKCQTLLNQAGIINYKQLAGTSIETLNEILDGVPVNSANWPAAAAHFLERIATPGEAVEYFRENRKELEGQAKRAQRVLNKLLPELLAGRFGKVTGYGVGFRTKGNKTVLPLQYVIQVCVESKLPDNVLKKRKLKNLPQQINGIKIKVGEVRPYHPTSSNVVAPVGDKDVEGGFPVAEANKFDGRFNSGTLGFVVPTRTGPVGIINKHFATVDRVMIQPPFDHWNQYNLIGSVQKAEYQENPGVDAAIIKLSNKTRKFIEGIRGFESNAKFFFAGRRLNNDDVFSLAYKYGAKSGSIIDERQQGMISSVDFNVNIDGRPFRRILHIESPRSFNISGDSGSVLCLDISEHSSAPTYLIGGLIFGGALNSELYGYACHWYDVMKLMDLKIPKRKLLTTWNSAKAS